MYAGRFTLVESDFILLKPLSNLRTQYASFLISNEPIGGVFSIEKIRSHIYGIPLKKYAFNTVSNLMYTLEFQTQS